MAIRNDLTVDWTLSPRIITVAAPSINITMQDLYDTLRSLASSDAAMDEDEIIDAGGKENLGGGVLVGLTVKFKNAQIKFEDRPAPTWVRCDITGGNLVAVDNNGADMDAVAPSSYVTITRTSSASATIAELEIANLQRLIENLRPHHTGTGNIFYWNPASGSDMRDGKSPFNAVATFAKAHDLCTDGNHDVIIALDTVGGVMADEAITITKKYVFLRGQGRGFVIEPTTIPGDAITINAIGCQIAGVRVNTAAGGYDSIVVNAGFSDISNVWVDECSGNGVVYNNSIYNFITGGYFRSVTGHGIKCNTGANHIWIDGLGIHGAGGDGIHIEGASQCYEIKVTGKTDIHWCNGYGINILQGGSLTRVGSDLSITGNALGSINDPNQKVVLEGGDAGLGAKLIDIHDETFGKWVLDPVAKTMTLYKPDGIAILKQFNLTEASGNVPAFIERVPV